MQIMKQNKDESLHCILKTQQLSTNVQHSSSTERTSTAQLTVNSVESKTFPASLPSLILTGI